MIHLLMLMSITFCTLGLHAGGQIPDGALAEFFAHTEIQQTLLREAEEQSEAPLIISVNCNLQHTESLTIDEKPIEPTFPKLNQSLFFTHVLGISLALVGAYSIVKKLASSEKMN